MAVKDYSRTPARTALRQRRGWGYRHRVRAFAGFVSFARQFKFTPPLSCFFSLLASQLEAGQWRPPQNVPAGDTPTRDRLGLEQFVGKDRGLSFDARERVWQSKQLVFKIILFTYFRRG